MSLPDEQAQIDAKLRELDAAIAELQKKRQELMQKKIKPESVRSAAQEPRPQGTEKALERALNMLEWKSFKKKDGEWAFLRDRDGSLVEDLRSATEFVDQLRRGRQIVVGKYRYSASEDKFLNRFLAAD